MQHSLKIATLTALATLFVGAEPVRAQLSAGAYRVLGQPDFRQDGINGVQGLELNAPSGVALGVRAGKTRLYISDSQNHRVLGWADALGYSNGERPALVLGQPDLSSSNPMGLGYKGLFVPSSLTVDPLSGDLYVADTGNSRVLRFADPFSNLARVEPDAVFGQPNFQTLTANSTGVGKSSLRNPQAVAFDRAGNLWIGDTGNHRVLRMPAASLKSGKTAEADIVLGQADFVSAAGNRGGPVGANTLFSPTGLAFDAQGALYISDYNNTRVLKYDTPEASGAVATSVFGQANLTTRGIPIQPTESSMAGPAGLSVGPDGSLYVGVPLNHRILVFDSSVSSSPAKMALGQSTPVSVEPDSQVYPMASESVLLGVSDVKVDGAGNLFIADTGNNRALFYPQGSKSATRVWGQPDYRHNGINQTKAGSINSPYKIVVDYSRAPFALYVSDTDNNRVLIWRDAVHFRNGDDADLVIGQPDMHLSAPNADGYGKPTKSSLFAPKGMAIDGGGNLYVTDSGNHRVLRFPRPVEQSGRIAPDMVLGQVDFTTADSAAVNASSFRSPSGVAFGPNGNLFISDSGNNRVLEFPANAESKTLAIRVYGQPDFTSSGIPAAATAQTMYSPQGLVVDNAFNLYVADYGLNRVLIFSNTKDAAAASAAASAVIGQDKFTTLAPGTAANRLHGPTDVALDSTGAIYVVDSLNNRALVYPSIVLLPNSGGAAKTVVGQFALTGSTPNWDAAKPDNIAVGVASAKGLYRPQGMFVDRQDTLYIGDGGNNRVLQFLKSIDVVNVVGTTPSSAPGGIVSAYGVRFAETTETSNSASIPFSLAGRELAVEDSMPAPLYFVSPGQINFQVPAAAPVGTLRVALRRSDTGELIAGGTLGVAKTAPALFATALNQDGSPNTAANPAAKGSTIQIYGVGQGEVSPAVSDGIAAGSSPLSKTIAQPTSDGATCLNSQPSMCVAIGSAFAEVTFSGLAPGLVGVWQINAKIPANAATNGSIPIRVVINGSSSNLISVAVK